MLITMKSSRYFCVAVQVCRAVLWAKQRRLRNKRGDWYPNILVPPGYNKIDQINEIFLIISLYSGSIHLLDTKLRIVAPKLPVIKGTPSDCSKHMNPHPPKYSSEFQTCTTNNMCFAVSQITDPQGLNQLPHHTQEIQIRLV